MQNQTILVLDFGGQYKELIARRVREIGVYSRVEPSSITLEQIKEINPIGIILTGGTNSVCEETMPKYDKALFDLNIPVLGICYGCQIMAYSFGAKLTPCEGKEYGEVACNLLAKSPLFDTLEGQQEVFMNHADCVFELPNGFVTTSATKDCPNASFENAEKKLYGVQFHPEVDNSANGRKMLENFVYNVCGATGDYGIEDVIETEIQTIRSKVGNKKVLLALSGGVDSSVCAALISRAIPNQLVCIFVDHGFMRKNEPDEIEKVFSNMDLDFVRVDASERFLSKVAGVTEPEKKRKIIGAEFIKVFEEESKKHGDCAFLAQGTIYPDVIESGANNNANIKSHHNVGGLPKDIGFEGLIEPLRSLFKNEVRELGKKLGLPDYLVNRQPFPGPGLAVRVIGELTKERCDILRDADYIFRTELEKAGVVASQYFAILTNLRSVGVKSEERTYDYTLALRAILTTDFMTAEVVDMPISLLKSISKKITTEVKGVNRVVYDITSKPPATIEWE